MTDPLIAAPALTLERVPNGFIITNVLPSGDHRTLAFGLDGGTDELNGAMQYPFIGDSGQVGICLRLRDGRSEYIYFNTSDDFGNGGRDEGPGFNTFVYQGTSGHPAEDDPQHFYYIFDEPGD